jgi:hypothetical protein
VGHNNPGTGTASVRIEYGDYEDGSLPELRITPFILPPLFSGSTSTGTGGTGIGTSSLHLAVPQPAHTRGGGQQWQQIPTRSGFSEDVDPVPPYPALSPPTLTSIPTPTPLRSTSMPDTLHRSHPTARSPPSYRTTASAPGAGLTALSARFLAHPPSAASSIPVTIGEQPPAYEPV